MRLSLIHIFYLRDEQRQSSFKPVACELKIGRGEDAVPGQVYRLSDGRTVQLVGTVDRADEWIEEDGTRWVRVVDYKTGSKKLDLKEVYCGLDCQMLLYLFSLTRDPSGRFTGAEPALSLIHIWMRDEYNMRRRLVVRSFNEMGLHCFCLLYTSRCV